MTMRYALVTGAASGMGRATAGLMQTAGWTPLLVDYDADGLQAFSTELRKSGPVELLAGDLTDASLINRLRAKLSEHSFSAAVHCAGVSPVMGGVTRILDVNLAASIALVDAFSELMADGSSVVLFASSAGHMVSGVFDAQISEAIAQHDMQSLHGLASEPELAYAISKRGVQLLARDRALGFGRRNMRINSISPGIIDTPMARAEMAKQPLMRTLVENAPLPRLADSREVGAVANFLCSREASFVTGIDILVDGGSMTVGSQRLSA